MLVSFQIKQFNNLAISELYDIMKLRQEVFVVEQNCPYLDADGHDDKAIHVLGKAENDQLAAYIRIFRPKTYYNEAAIGRVVVGKNYRGMGLGYDVMKFGISYCNEHFAGFNIKIGAQVYLDKFYKSLGFMPSSGTYLEDGIEHQYMIFKNN